MLSSSLVGVTSFIEDDAGVSFTGDVGLTFRDVLDAVKIDVILLVELVVAFVDGLGVNSRFNWTRNQTITSLIYITISECEAK